MADGTSVPVGVMTPAMAGARRAGSMKRFAQRRSTTAFLLCLPLILLVAGFVVYPAFYAVWLSLLNKKMTAFVGLSNFAFLLKRNTFQLVIFQSCLFAITAVIAKAILGFIIAHLMHNIPGKNQRIWRGLRRRTGSHVDGSILGESLAARLLPRSTRGQTPVHRQGWIATRADACRIDD